MERSLQRDQQYQKTLKLVRMVYVLTGLLLALRGFRNHNIYQFLLSLSTLLLLPGLSLMRRWTRWEGGWQVETYVYLFSFLGWTLGGAGEVYSLLPGYDKLVHGLSGIFVAMLMLILYELLECRHSREGANPATGYFFVFFGSMAVAGMFELCEFTLSTISGRDLQHVLDTGVTDTMGDIFVCMVGTLIMLWLMHRSAHGKHDPVTDAAAAFVYHRISQDRGSASD